MSLRVHTFPMLCFAQSSKLPPANAGIASAKDTVLSGAEAPIDWRRRLKLSSLAFVALFNADDAGNPGMCCSMLLWDDVSSIVNCSSKLCRLSMLVFI